MIRWHNITIDGRGVSPFDYANPELYEVNVAFTLGLLPLTWTGSAVLYTICHGCRRRALHIRPFNDRNQENAFSQADDARHSTLRGAYEGQDKQHHPVYGLGGGSNATLHYSPTTWYRYHYRHRGHDAGATADDVLLHEMTHAMRQMSGLMDKTPLGHNYDNEEEFYAILVANIYASEWGRNNDLRLSHHSHDHLGHDQDASAKFLPKRDMHDYRYRLIRKLVDEEPQLCHRIAMAPAKFNPIRRYFELQHHSHHQHHHHHHHGQHAMAH